MRPRWSPAIAQGLQQHGGSVRHAGRPENAGKSPTGAPVEADRPEPDAGEPRGVNPTLANLASG
jgi:hypothetical protein